jgi:hypothetical protein
MGKKIIEVPLLPIVKKYFQHESNLGMAPIIEKRHWVGRHLCSIVSFHPLEKIDLPIEYSIKNMEKLETLTMQITFPLKINLIDIHHLLAIGAAMDSVFELAVLNFCRGRFDFSMNYSAAISSFFTRYDLYSTDYDSDYFRRFINKKYGSTLKQEYEKARIIREELLAPAKND